MPYPEAHKRETRARIVENARRLFNHKGFSAVSIDEIMAAAGLTRGGFYNHFRTKEDLFVEAVAAYGECNPAAHWDTVEFDPGAEGAALARQLVDAYLSHEHLGDVDWHCPLIALPSDVARAGAGVRRAYRDLFEGMATILGQGAGGDAARERGLAVAALCVGAMVLARTFDDADYAADVREAARALARELVTTGDETLSPA